MNHSGLGTDLIEIQRIRDAIQRHGDRLLKYLFTERELVHSFCFRDPAPTLSGRFAAKEAVSKALGTGVGARLGWHDIEVLNNAEGKPEVYLGPRWQNYSIQLSISHAKEYAIAVAIAFQLRSAI